MNYQDTIETLPVEESKPNQEQLALAMSIFEYEKEMNCVGSEVKDVVSIVILFILFSLPQLDELLKKYIPQLRNQVFLVTFKCICVVFLYYMFKNYQVIKHQK